MAVGTEVGRIYIKVSPDTDGFRGELRRQLAAIKDDFKVNVDAVVKNAAQAEAQLDKVARDRKTKIDAQVNVDRFEKRLIGQIDKALSDHDAKLDVTVDDEKLRRKWKAQAADLKDMLRLPVDVDPELAAKDKAFLLGSFQRLLSEMQAFANAQPIDVKAKINRESLVGDLSPGFIQKTIDQHGETVKIKAEIDRASAYAAAASWQTTMANHRIEVAMTPKVEAGKFARAHEYIKRSFGHGIKVNVDFDTNKSERGVAKLAFGFANLAQDAAGAAAKVGSGFISMAGGVAQAASSLPLMAGALIVIVPLLTLISPLLALIAGSLVALPGLFAAIAAPIGVVALGLDGIKKAAENAGIWDSKGGKDGKGGLGKALDDIKTKVSDTFEKGLTPAFDAVAKMFPKLESGFVSVANGVSQIGQGIANGLSNNAPAINRIFDSIGQALARAKPGVEAFTSAFVQLIDKISAKFPGLADSFNKLGDQFLKWVQDFTAPKADLGGLSQLDVTLRSLRETLGSLTGIGFDLIKQGLHDISNPAFGEGMKGFVDTARTWIQEILPMLTKGFQELSQAIQAAEPAIRLLGFFGKLGDFASNPVSAIKESIDALNKGDGIAGALTGLPGGKNNPFSTLPAQAKEAGTQAQAALKQGLFGGSGDGVAGGGVIQQQLFGTPGANAAAAQAAITTPAAQAAQQAATQVGMFGAQAQTDIANATNQLDLFGAQAAGLNNAAAQLNAAWVTVIQTMTTGATQAIMAVTNSFATLPNAVIGPMTSMGAQVAGTVQNIVAIFGVMGTEVNRVVTTSFGQLPTQVQTAMDAMNAALVSGGAMCVQTVAAWGAQMVSTAMGFAGAMQGAGAAVGSAFAAGLSSMTGVVSAAAQNLMASASAMFPHSPAEEGPFSGKGWVTFSGQAIGQGFAQGIGQGTNDVVSAAKAMMQAIKDVFGDASGLTLNFNFGAGGFGGGASTPASAFSGVQSSMSGVVSSAKELQTVMTDTSGASQMLASDAKARVSDLTQQLSLLEQQRKELEISRFNDPKNEAIKAQLEQIRQQKLLLGLEKDKLSYATKYGGVVDDTKNSYGDQLKNLGQMPIDFAKTTANQFLGDFGISGNGMLSNLANIGLDYGSKFIFNVSNVDEAMAVQQNQQYKQSQGLVGR